MRKLFETFVSTVAVIFEGKPSRDELKNELEIKKGRLLV